MIHFVSKLPKSLQAGNIYFVKTEDENTGSLIVGDRQGNPVEISSKELIRACVDAQAGQASGLATLNKEGKIPADQLPEQAMSKSQVEQIIAGKLESFAAGAPDALNTLQELSDALNSDPDFASNLTAQLAGKANADAVYSKTVMDEQLSAIQQGLEAKQDALPNAEVLAQLGNGTFGGKAILVVDTIEW